jgi:hypothetical protein
MRRRAADCVTASRNGPHRGARCAHGARPGRLPANRSARAASAGLTPVTIWRLAARILLTLPGRGGRDQLVGMLEPSCGRRHGSPVRPLRALLHRALRQDQPDQADTQQLRAGRPAGRIAGQPRPWPRCSWRPSCWRGPRLVPPAAVSCAIAWPTATSRPRASCRADWLIARLEPTNKAPRLLGLITWERNLGPPLPRSAEASAEVLFHRCLVPETGRSARASHSAGCSVTARADPDPRGRRHGTGPTSASTGPGPANGEDFHEVGDGVFAGGVHAVELGLLAGV